MGQRTNIREFDYHLKLKPTNPLEFVETSNSLVWYNLNLFCALEKEEYFVAVR